MASSADPRPTGVVTASAAVADMPQGEAGERAFLVVYLDAAGGGQSWVVELPDGAEVTFGRSRGTTIVIEHENVSREHARITRRGAAIQVEDRGSRNGTRVNGEKIAGPTRLASGDEIGVGPALVVLSQASRLAERTVIGGPSYLEERLAGETERAHRYRHPCGLIMLRVDGAPQACEAAVDRVAGLLRRMDGMAEYGPEEYAIVLPVADRAATEAAVGRFLREARVAGLAEGGVTVHVGHAVCPEDGIRPGELLSRARAALRAARTGGGQDGSSEAAAEGKAGDGDVIVVDPQMQRLHALVQKVAPSNMTVLVLGETGVGKEVVAQEVHRNSPRAARPFVKLNCAALSETLLESELFGHERGAFTGAEQRHAGYFETAHGGTLFLDEIGEIPLSLQPKLLRVLQERTMVRVGGTSELKVDIRLVCATNRDLWEEVRRGRFREDLYFRINSFPLVVPPLRDRRAEIRPLAERFSRQFALELSQPPPSISSDAMELLVSYTWPGNVRELRNTIERAVVLATTGSIEAEHLPLQVRESTPSAPVTAVRGDATRVREQVASVERAAIVAALEQCGGNQTQAALVLGLSRRTLIYKLEKYRLKPPRKQA